VKRHKRGKALRPAGQVGLAPPAQRALRLWVVRPILVARDLGEAQRLLVQALPLRVVAGRLVEAPAQLALVDPLADPLAGRVVGQVVGLQLGYCRVARAVPAFDKLSRAVMIQPCWVAWTRPMIAHV
jgi:hypothetical protein